MTGTCRPAFPVIAMQGGESDDKEEFSGHSTHSANPVPEAAAQQTFSDECTSRGGLCLIAFLDPASRQHTQHLATLQTLRGLRRCVMALTNTC
jgi:hypothetical protein